MCREGCVMCFQVLAWTVLSLDQHCPVSFIASPVFLFFFQIKSNFWFSILRVVCQYLLIWTYHWNFSWSVYCNIYCHFLSSEPCDCHFPLYPTKSLVLWMSAWSFKIVFFFPSTVFFSFLFFLWYIGWKAENLKGSAFWLADFCEGVNISDL